MIDLYKDIKELFENRGFNPIVGTIHKMKEVWLSWYRGNVNDFHYYKLRNVDGNDIHCERKTLNMAKRICEDWAGYLYNENVVFNFEDDKADEVLKRVLKRNNFYNYFSNFVELVFALGNGAIIQYISNGETKIDFINSEFLITDYHNGKVNGIVTVNRKKIDKNEYTLLSHHLYKNGVYSVEHEVYVDRVSKTGSKRNQNQHLGKKVDLAVGGFFSEEEAKNLLVVDEKGNERYLFSIESECAFFQIYKPNIANNYNPFEPYGISIFANVIDNLKAIDTIYDISVAEHEDGRMRLLISSEATKEKMELDERTGETKFIKYFDSSDRVYISIPSEMPEKVPFKEFAPTLRTEQHKTKLNEELALLGFKSGFGKNYYQFNSGIQSNTATEVMHNKSDLFRAKVKHENLILKQMENMAYAIISMENLLGNLPADIDVNDLKLTIRSDDSIIINDEEQYNKDKQNVLDGLMPKKHFLMKWYDLNEKEAVEWLENIEEENIFNLKDEEETTDED